jgi:hypothetical protein
MHAMQADMEEHLWHEWDAYKLRIVEFQVTVEALADRVDSSASKVSPSIGSISRLNGLLILRMVAPKIDFSLALLVLKASTSILLSLC